MALKTKKTEEERERERQEREAQRRNSAYQSNEKRIRNSAVLGGYQATGTSRGTSSSTSQKSSSATLQRPSERRQIPSLQKTTSRSEQRRNYQEENARNAQKNIQNDNRRFSTGKELQQIKNGNDVDKWVQPDYKLSKEEVKKAKEITSDFYKKHPEFNGNTMAKVDPRSDLAKEAMKMATLRNKTSLTGQIGSGLMDTIKSATNAFLGAGKALTKDEETKQAIDELQNFYGSSRENARTQNGLAYGAGQMAGKTAQYMATNPLFDRAAESLGATSAVGKFITNQLGQNAQDLVLDTLPTLAEYARDGSVSAEERRDLAKNVGMNVAGNLAIPAIGAIGGGIASALRANGMPDVARAASNVDISDAIRQQNIMDAAESAQRNIPEYTNFPTGPIQNIEPEALDFNPFRERVSALPEGPLKNQMSGLLDQANDAYNNGHSLEARQVIDDVFANENAWNDTVRAAGGDIDIASMRAQAEQIPNLNMRKQYNSAVDSIEDAVRNGRVSDAREAAETIMSEDNLNVMRNVPYNPADDPMDLGLSRIQSDSPAYAKAVEKRDAFRSALERYRAGEISSDELKQAQNEADYAMRGLSSDLKRTAYRTNEAAQAEVRNANLQISEVKKALGKKNGKGNVEAVLSKKDIDFYRRYPNEKKASVLKRLNESVKGTGVSFREAGKGEVPLWDPNLMEQLTGASDAIRQAKNPDVGLGNYRGTLYNAYMEAVGDAGDAARGMDNTDLANRALLDQLEPDMDDMPDADAAEDMLRQMREAGDVQNDDAIQAIGEMAARETEAPQIPGLEQTARQAQDQIPNVAEQARTGYAAMTDDEFLSNLHVDANGNVYSDINNQEFWNEYMRRTAENADFNAKAEQIMNPTENAAPSNPIPGMGVNRGADSVPEGPGSDEWNEMLLSIGREDKVSPEYLARRNQIPNMEDAVNQQQKSVTDRVMEDVMNRDSRSVEYVGQTRTNSIGNSGVFTEDELKEIVPEDMFVHASTTEKQALSSSINELSNDWDGHVNRYSTIMDNKAIKELGGNDVDKMFMTQDRINQQLREATDPEEISKLRQQARNIARNIDALGHKAGGDLQRFAKWTRTPQGAIATAEGRMLNMVEDALTPKAKNQISDLAKSISSKLEGVEDVEEARKIIQGELGKLGKKKVSDIQVNKLTEDILNDKAFDSVLEQLEFFATGHSRFTDEVYDQVQQLFEEAQKLPYNSRERVKLEQQAFSVLGNAVAPMGGTFRQKFDTWRFFSMLANPTTHLKNELGNKTFGTVVGAKNTLAAMIEENVDRVMRANGGNGIQRTKSVLTKADDALVKACENDAFENAYREISTGSKYFNASRSLDEAMPVYNTNKKAGRILNKITDFNSNLLSKEDEMAMVSKYKTSLAGYIKANGYDQSILNSTDESAMEFMEGARAYALHQAEVAAFHQESKTANYFSQFTSNLRDSNSVAGKTLGTAIDVAIPFKKTPINILKSCFEYSPAEFLKVSADIKALRNGSLSAADFIDDISKATVGTSGLAIGAFLANEGIISVGSDKSDEERKFDKTTGKGNVALHIGKASIGLSELMPAAAPIIYGVSLYESFKNAQDGDGNKALNALISGASAIANNVTDMTMLSGIADILGTVKYSEGNEIWRDLGIAFFGNIGSQMLPTLGRKMEITLDDTKRSTYSDKSGPSKVIDQQLKYWQTKVPGSQALGEYLERSNIPALQRAGERLTLEPAIDAWGREIQNTGGNMAGRALYNTVGALEYNYDISDATDEEIYRLNEATGNTDVFHNMPTSDSKFKDADKNEIKLTPEQWTDYQKLNGQTSKEIVDAFVSDERYQALSDEDKAAQIKNIYDFAKAIGQNKYGKAMSSANQSLADAYDQYGAQGVIDSLFNKVASDANDAKIESYGVKVNQQTKNIYSRFGDSGMEYYSKNFDKINADGKGDVTYKELLKYANDHKSEAAQAIDIFGDRLEGTFYQDNSGNWKYDGSKKREDGISATGRDLKDFIKSGGAITANAAETTDYAAKRAAMKENYVGNVDINHRPIVINDDGSYSTTETSFQEKKIGDGYRIAHFTPITKDGKYIPDAELNSYIDDVLNAEDPMAYDKAHKGIVYKVDTTLRNGQKINDSNLEAAFKEADSWDTEMHEKQDRMYSEEAQAKLAKLNKSGNSQNGGYQLSERKKNSASYERYQELGNTLKGYKISDKDYDDMFKAIDADSNESIKKAEVTAYLDSRDDLSSEEKSALFKVYAHANWNNPYAGGATVAGSSGGSGKSSGKKGSGKGSGRGSSRKGKKIAFQSYERMNIPSLRQLDSGRASLRSLSGGGGGGNVIPGLNLSNINLGGSGSIPSIASLMNRYQNMYR